MDERDAKRRRWGRDLLCGALIGAGAILPGISGGVLAVVFDVYRPMMETLAHPLGGLRRHWRLFLPLGLGWAVGFLGLAWILSAAYDWAAAATVWLFLGLIAGTFPALWREAGRQGRSAGAFLCCGLCAAAVLGTLLYVRNILHFMVEPNFWWYNFCGVLWGASVVLPGLSSAPVLMALGLYEPMLQGLAALEFSVLAAAVPGMVVTVALLARIVTYLLERHYAVIFHGIVGVVAASGVVIIPTAYSGPGEILASVVCCIGGFFLAAWMERLNEGNRE